MPLRLIQLMLTSGKPVYLNTRQVVSVCQSEADDVAILTTAGPEPITVRDPLEQVVREIDLARAREMEHWRDIFMRTAQMGRR